MRRSPIPVLTGQNVEYGNFVDASKSNIVTATPNRHVELELSLILEKLHIFTARRYASAVLAVVVCPSVCPSVRLSQAGIVSKRQHIESRKQRRTVAQGI